MHSLPIIERYDVTSYTHVGARYHYALNSTDGILTVEIDLYYRRTENRKLVFAKLDRDSSILRDIASSIMRSKRLPGKVMSANVVGNSIIVNIDVSGDLLPALLKGKWFIKSNELSYERQKEVESSVAEEWMEAIECKTQRCIQTSGFYVSIVPSKEAVAHL